jgi:hypothetical protein
MILALSIFIAYAAGFTIGAGADFRDQLQYLQGLAR